MMARALAGKAIAVSCVAGCFAATPVMTFGGGKSSEQVQHEGIDKLLPAQIAAPAARSGAVRVAKIRVWADDEYRAQNMRWQRGFDEQLDYANRVLAPMLGVRIEAEYRAWQRHAPGSTLNDAIAALAREDPGDDAVWVIGLTSSLSLVASTFEQIGASQLAGRHLVLRGHAHGEERAAFDRAFPDIDASQRLAVLEARERHKTTAVLIHELAHSLGALHEAAPEVLMSPMYSHRAAEIDPHNRAVMQIVLDDRLVPAGSRDTRAAARKALAVFEGGWDGWNARDRDQIAANLRAMLGEPAAPAGARGEALAVAPAAATAPGAASTRSTGHGRPPTPPATALQGGDHRAVAPGMMPTPPAALSQYKRVEQQMFDRDAPGAAAEFAPLLAAYPTNSSILLLHCRLEILRTDVTEPAAVTACDRAAASSPDVGPALDVARTRRTAGDLDGARATLVAAEARLAGLPADRAAASWLALADLYRDREEIAAADRAITRFTAGAPAGADDLGVAAWVRMMRLRFGIPRDGARYKLAPGDDVDALSAVRDATVKLNQDHFDAAAKVLAAADKRWPGLPGLAAARCDLEIRRGALAAARQYCARAAARDESSWAVYLLGAIATHDTSPASIATAVARFRKAIELDPSLAQAYLSLAKILRRNNRIPELDDVRHAYQAEFGAPLPP